MAALNISVGRKIVLLSLIVGALFAAVGGIGLAQSQRLTAQLDQQYRRDVVALSHMTTVGEALGAQNSAVLSHVLSDPGFYRDGYEKKIEETDRTIRQELDTLSQLDLTPRQKNQLNSLEALLPAWREALDEALEASRQGDRARATSMVLVRSQALGEALQTRVSEIVKELDLAVAAGADRARASSAATTRLMVACLIGAAIIAGALSLLVARTIARPLRRAVTVLRGVESGDFSHRLRVRGRDEVGQMATSLNRTLDVLEDSFTTMRYQASHDSLTGLANRALFHERVAEALVHANRRQDAAVVLIDLNDFKSVNDVYGHAVGDALLVEIGRRLRAHIGPGDVAARLGGDEFAVLLGELESPEQLVRAANDLHRIIETTVQINGISICPRASIGIAPWRQHRHIDELLHEADVAMYAEKSAGRRGGTRFLDQGPSSAF